MNKLRALPLCILVTLIFWLPPVFAWNPAGHMAIARAAFEKLDATHQHQLAGLLRKHPRFADDFEGVMPPDLSAEEQDRWIFERAAAWPDVARSLPTQEQLKYNRPAWHYIDVPIYLDDEARAKIQLPALDFGYPTSVHDANLNAVQALKKNLAEFRDPKKTDSERAVAVCWILHLTGDIHQPLHGAALFSAGRFRQIPMGDKGGNDIPVHENYGMIQPPSKPNLHSIWDAMLGTDASTAAIKSLADAIIASNSAANLAEPLKDQLIEHWSFESNAAAIKSVYTPEVLSIVKGGESHPHEPLPTFEVDDGYLAQAKPVALKRAVLAVYRTVQLLNQ